ncbi:DmsE family decaheme c-type cytochrome [Ferrimonas sp. YFM]|uniref:DmsE family decaheme c-type cytochrome n=1 Tax=Ferrimonas sp. YFM TaxID=3028878 RepID=UPI0025724596|nr:DmsE family decaheme c-type cytochrome [Ferrimonas sp. YFM]BDY04572.1 cystathionine beta-synthase [Ferrimonas sp. YFM]
MHGWPKILIYLSLAGVTLGPVSAQAAPWQDLSSAQLEELLVKKFEQGQYSKKGADTCLTCHRKSDQVMAIFSSAHGDTFSPGSPMAELQCETCHGPLGKHNRGGKEPMITFGSDSQLSAQSQNSVCLGCHSDSQSHDWHGSTHQMEELSCTSCHSVHQADNHLSTVSDINAQCSSCHAQQSADKHKRSSHPLAWGQMSCISCHNPHGGSSEFALNELSVNDNCYSCHAEKRGPVLWEHAPVTEDCSICHDPHGSVNKALLKQDAPQLCQQCHLDDGHASKVVRQPGADAFGAGRSCLNCHSQIHGSNHPAGSNFSR